MGLLPAVYVILRFVPILCNENDKVKTHYIEEFNTYIVGNTQRNSKSTNCIRWFWSFTEKNLEEVQPIGRKHLEALSSARMTRILHLLTRNDNQFSNMSDRLLLFIWKELSPVTTEIP